MQAFLLCLLTIMSLRSSFQTSSLRKSFSFATPRISRTPSTSHTLPRKPIQRSTRLFALPPVAESILAIASVVAIHEAGHFLAAKSQGVRIESFNIGYGPKLLAFNDSENVEFTLRAFPVGGYVSFPSNLDVSDEGVEIIDEDPLLLENKSALSRLVVMSGGVLANILLSIALNANIALTSGIPFPVFSDGLVVTALSSPSALSPARQAGLAANDVLLRVNGEKIPRGLDSVSDFVATIRRNENAAVRLTVRQGGEAGMEKEVVVTPRSEGGRASIGIGIAPRIVDVNIRKAQSPVEALLIGVDQTSRLVSLTGSSVVKGIRTGFAGMEVSGPLSVITQGASFIEDMSSQASPSSASPFLAFAASLSVNLAALNALPLPALDGGQFLLALSELVSRRKIPRKLKANITAVSFLFLLVVTIWTSLGDISKLALLFR